MANLDISQNKLEEAASYLIQYLRDSGFEGSTEAGTGIYDVLIRPSAMLYALFNDMATKAKVYNSITEAENQRSVIGEEEYSSAIDSILSNWFVTRKDGNKSTCTVRLYFIRIVPYFEITKDGTPKVSVNGINYDVIRNYVLSSSNFSSIYNSERNAVEYYTDIELESIDNTEATSGDVIPNINSIYLLRAVLIGDVVSGKSFESTEDFIARTKQVITTRELISNNAIFTNLQETFTGIRELYIAGFGFPEQLRDVVFFNDVDIHVGNKADIYLNIDLETSETSCFVNSTGVVSLQPISRHIADVINVRHSLKTEGKLRLHCITTPSISVTIPTTIDFYPTSNSKVPYSVKAQTTILTTDWIDCYNPGEVGVYYDIDVVSDLFSTLNPVTIVLKNEVFGIPNELNMVADITAKDNFHNLDISFEMSYVSILQLGTVGTYPICTITDNTYIGNISDCIIRYLGNDLYNDVWNYITDSSNRVICYDPIIKSKYIIYLDCDITISTTGLSTKEDIESERQSCQDAVVNYINKLTKDDVFSVYDMLVAIDNTCANIDRVKTPVSVTYRFQDPESLIYYTGSISDSFSLSDIVLGAGESLSLMVSTNTFQYYTNSYKVNITVDKAIY